MHADEQLVLLHSEEELRAAWAVCRCDAWPDTFEATMLDPLRARMVDTVASGRARKRAPAPAVGTEDEARCSNHNAACLQVQPSRRCANCIHRPPPPTPRFHALPAGAIDHKRAAAGDRDD